MGRAWEREECECRRMGGRQQGERVGEIWVSHKTNMTNASSSSSSQGGKHPEIIQSQQDLLRSKDITTD